MKTLKADVLVTGGGTSAFTAAVQAARMGSSTILCSDIPWPGGMLTAAGVSAVDGNFNLPSGIFGELRESLVKHYGSLERLASGWVSRVLFEPHVAANIINEMLDAEPVRALLC